MDPVPKREGGMREASQDIQPLAKAQGCRVGDSSTQSHGAQLNGEPSQITCAGGLHRGGVYRKDPGGRFVSHVARAPSPANGRAARPTQSSLLFRVPRPSSAWAGVFDQSQTAHRVPGADSGRVPWSLKHFQQSGQNHYLTFSCYHRQPKLGTPAPRLFFYPCAGKRCASSMNCSSQASWSCPSTSTYW